MWKQLQRAYPRPLTALFGLAASFGLLVSPVAGGLAHADSQGFIDNFPGWVVVQYAHSNASTGQYDTTPLPASVPSLKQTLDSQWAVIQPQACQMLRQQIQPSAWNSCHIKPVGELRAKQIASRSVGLKYVVAGNDVNFDLGTNGLGSWADATFEVTFDAELDLTLNVANVVDGAVPSNSGDFANQPVTIAGATFHLTNVQISTKNVIANLLDLITGAFGKAEAALQTPQNVQSLVLPAVQAMNQQIHTGARSLGDSIRATNPASNWYFNFDASVQPGQLVVRLRRDFDPPAMPNCTPFYQSGPVAQALTYCANTSDTLTIQLQQSTGAWVNEPTQASDYYGSGRTKLLDANVLSQPGTVTYRVCGANMYGVACGPASSISPNFSPPSYGGGASGPGPVINPHHPPLQ
jgi:hypothetical protein